MEKMKVLYLFLFGLLIGCLVIYVVPSLHAKAALLLTYSACDKPLAYSLGHIDSQFGLSNSEIVQDIQEATSIWSKADQKNLFVYSPAATLTVNFVYDERQALNSSINHLQSQLSQSNQSLNQQVAQYQADVASFKTRLANLNATIESYNQQGGAPPDVYKQLIQQQNELRSEGIALNNRARELNQSTNGYNDTVTLYNNDVTQLQNDLAQKPEEGLYNGQDDTITIYLTNTHAELIHTLAHEFGHSLGMGHVQDPKAIMYPYTSESLNVTADDLSQLTYVCRRQSIFLHNLEVFDTWIVTQAQTLTNQISKQHS